MPAPAATVIYVYIGTTKPDVAWRFLSGTQPFDGTGSTFILTIECMDQRIEKSTAVSDGGLVYDTTTGTLTWHRTLSESRQIAPGNYGKYEIERRYGSNEQEYIVAGNVVGVGGLSSD